MSTAASRSAFHRNALQLFRRKARRQPQDRERREADEKHSEFHDETRYHKWTIAFHRVERNADNFFDGDVCDFWPGLLFSL